MSPTQTPYNTPCGAVEFSEPKPEMTSRQIIRQESEKMRSNEKIALSQGHEEAAKGFRLCREALEKLLDEQKLNKL